jgi:hypothetical protein
VKSTRIFSKNLVTGQLMNSLPLSQWKARMTKGNSYSVASTTGNGCCSQIVPTHPTTFSPRDRVHSTSSHCSR